MIKQHFRKAARRALKPFQEGNKLKVVLWSLLQWHVIVHFSGIWFGELKGGRVIVKRRGACSGRAVQLGTTDNNLGTCLNALGSG